MAEILLLRHAKSDHPAGMTDRDRPLTSRGERSAHAIGRAIAEFGATPDLILTSPARRATDTATLARDGGAWSAPIITVEDFYGTGVITVFGALADHGSVHRILAVGHEPTWSATVSALIGGGAVHMVTAAVACVETALPATPGSGWLRWMLHPRLFTDRA
ncbi:MAG: histidine phosphatase family protein [Acidimicrobiia bacterium]